MFWWCNIVGLQTYIDQVEGLYTSGHVDETPLDQLISRADFWTLGAIEAINYGCEKAQGNCRRNCPPVPYPNIVLVCRLTDNKEKAVKI